MQKVKFISSFFLFFIHLNALAAPSKEAAAGCVVRQELTVKGPGIVSRILVVEGSQVKKGDKLIELDARLFEAGFKEALGAVDAAKANAELAADAYARLQQLKSGEAVTEQQIVEARIRAAQARAVLRQAEGAAERVKIQMEDSTLRAEVNGRVRGLPTTLGLAVQAGQSLGRIDVEPLPNCQTTSPVR